MSLSECLRFTHKTISLFGPLAQPPRTQMGALRRRKLVNAHVGGNNGTPSSFDSICDNACRLFSADRNACRNDINDNSTDTAPVRLRICGAKCLILLINNNTIPDRVESWAFIKMESLSSLWLRLPCHRVHHTESNSSGSRWQANESNRLQNIPLRCETIALYLHKSLIIVRWDDIWMMETPLYDDVNRVREFIYIFT